MQYKPSKWVSGYKHGPAASYTQVTRMGLFLNVATSKFEPLDSTWDNLHSGGMFISDDNKLYFRDETNKDIYINSPAAETLGLSAGNATTAGFVTINEEGFDTDFRVEASGVANALFVRGSDGNVGINCEPDTNLQVKGTSGYQAVRVSSGTIDIDLFANSIGSRVGLNVTDAVGMDFHTNSTLHMTIETGGDIEAVAGNLVIGTAGKGIDFSAQSSPAAGMTSELLDRYEEGTCSMIVTGVDTTGSAAAQLMHYQRVGNTVTVQGYITQTPTSAAGQVRITGLPFTAAASSGSGTSTLSGNAIATTGANLVDFTAGKIPFLYVEGNTAYLDGLEMTDDGSWTAWAVDTSASQAWFINISYTV